MHLGCSTKAAAVFPVPCVWEIPSGRWGMSLAQPCSLCRVFPCECCSQPSAATSRSCRTRDCGTQWEEVALCPGRGIHTLLCEWNGQCKKRDVPSCSHLVLSLLFVSLSRMGCAGTPVPCVLSQEVWGVTQGRYNSWFYSFLIFFPQRSTPVQEEGKHWWVPTQGSVCPIPIQGSQFAVLSVHPWRLLRERSEDLAKSFFRLKSWDIFSDGVTVLVWNRITGNLSTINPPVILWD